MKKDLSRPIFIVSTGRSGSQMIAKTLAQHPNLFALHEPEPHLALEAFACWKNSHDKSEIEKRVNNKREALLKKVNENNLTYIESSHYCSHLIPILDGLYDAKFIYLYRDGRNFVRSGLQRGWWYPNNLFSSHLSGSEMLLQPLKRIIRRKFLLDIGYLWEDHRLIPPRKYKTRFEKISWLWVEINSIIMESLCDLSDEQYISLKLEEFNSETIDKIVSFIGIKINKQIKSQMIKISKMKPNSTRNKSVLPFEDWSESDKEKFWNIAGKMMNDLNYT